MLFGFDCNAMAHRTERNRSQTKKWNNRFLRVRSSFFLLSLKLLGNFIAVVKESLGVIFILGRL
jgi:hypothetical protein